MYYKFNQINDNLIDSLSNNYLYFSQPSQFNDIFDSNIYISPKLSKSKKLEMFKKIIEEGNPIDFEMTNDELMSEAKRLSEKYEKKEFPPIQMDNNGICCFSKRYDNLYLWSIYADKFKGICLIFDFNNDKIVIGNKRKIKKCIYSEIFNVQYDGFTIGDVVYKKKLPSLPLDYKDDDILERFCTKLIDWEHEEEIRAVKFESYGKYYFHKQWLIGIIFGLNTTDVDKNKVINAIKNYSNITIYQSKLDENKKLKIEEGK
jgi:hypothetical protein